MKLTSVFFTAAALAVYAAPVPRRLLEKRATKLKPLESIVEHESSLAARGVMSSILGGSDTTSSNVPKLASSAPVSPNALGLEVQRPTLAGSRSEHFGQLEARPSSHQTRLSASPGASMSADQPKPSYSTTREDALQASKHTTIKSSASGSASRKTAYVAPHKRLQRELLTLSPESPPETPPRAGSMPSRQRISVSSPRPENSPSKADRNTWSKSASKQVYDGRLGSNLVTPLKPRFPTRAAPFPYEHVSLPAVNSGKFDPIPARTRYKEDIDAVASTAVNYFNKGEQTGMWAGPEPGEEIKTGKKFPHAFHTHGRGSKSISLDLTKDQFSLLELKAQTMVYPANRNWDGKLGYYKAASDGPGADRVVLTKNLDEDTWQVVTCFAHGLDEHGKPCFKPGTRGPRVK